MEPVYPTSPPNEPPEIALLDVRPAADFLAGHHPDAVSIPLEDVTRRTHELPSPDTELLIYDACRVRARWAASRLRARGRSRIDTRSGPDWIATHCTATGPSDKRLWRPHALLTDIALPAMRTAWGSLGARRALDLACGSGRDAVTMAISGLNVHAWDRYAEALTRCRELGESCGVGVTTRQIDVEASPALATDSFDAIACFNFLHRPLLPAMAVAIRPGGFVVYETFTIEQRVQFGKPRKDAHLLLPGELPCFFEGWRIVHYHEGQAAPRRIVASLVAQRPE
ncbi:MAG TPA: methyltransferase domain-containing protein [Phycisphaerae bacterium]|nr:methyltransferase domain-containing protein [Phycisphaerae bacterium]HRW52173.1 methyltransferase domain-containing protein [Phycisphaerae bacterium]